MMMFHTTPHRNGVNFHFSSIKEAQLASEYLHKHGVDINTMWIEDECRVLIKSNQDVAFNLLHDADVRQFEQVLSSDDAANELCRLFSNLIEAARHYKTSRTKVDRARFVKAAEAYFVESDQLTPEEIRAFQSQDMGPIMDFAEGMNDEDPNGYLVFFKEEVRKA